MKVFTGKLIIAALLSGTLMFGACNETDETTESREITVKTLSVTPENIILAAGEIRAAKATVTPDGANQEIYWKSADPNIATVANGIITGIAEGETTVSATSVVDATKSDELRIRVVKAAVPVESIVFDTAGKIEIYIGDEFPLQVIFTPENATNKEIIWRNSNPEAATLENGVIKGLARGTTVITAIAGADVNRKVSLEALVTDRDVPVQNISVSPEKIALVAGKSRAVSIVVAPDDAADKTLIWESSNNSVATVIDGTITAKSIGVAVITAKSVTNPDVSATVSVTVPDMSTFPAVFAEAAGLWLFGTPSDIANATIGSPLAIKGSGNPVSPVTGSNAVTVPKGRYFEANHGIVANGGGNNVNEYTMVIDFRIPATGQWYSFFQTNINNNDDAECFINTGGSIGVGATGYSGATVSANVWHRLIVTKLGTSYNIYLDGNNIVNASLSIDDRFSLSPNGVILLGDNDGDDADIDASGIAIWNRQLSAEEIYALGGASFVN
ncbi:MAG: Ig-like domain-containing protein [Tannerella sp.]|jgi:uncharacterized protein YjdB|nr:Ig-like domain-containing protein [Tannerella sp.]